MQSLPPLSPFSTPQVAPFALTISVHASTWSFSLIDVDLFDFLIIAVADVTARNGHCESHFVRRTSGILEKYSG